jgi:hypothetical protein
VDTVHVEAGRGAVIRGKDHDTVRTFAEGSGETRSDGDKVVKIPVRLVAMKRWRDKDLAK